MQLGLTGKRALVTGAGRGLGRYIALGLAQEGALVAVVSRTDSGLKTLMTQMGGVSAGHYSLASDLMPEGAPLQVIREVLTRFGPLDIVVHNLGGTLGIQELFCTIEEWRQVWRFNLEIAVEMNRTIIPAMQERKWGRVVHISSIAAVSGGSTIPYTTVKAALNTYVRGLGCRVAQDGVVVSAVMPGAIRSHNNPGYTKKHLNEKVAIKRFATAEEISDFVVFLCSECASFFSGAVIPIDGGTG